MATVDQKREYERRYREKYPERIKAAKEKYRLAHAAEIYEARKKHRRENREKLDAAKRAWELANPDLVAQQRARRRIKAMNAALNSGLRYHYGITRDEYAAVLTAQGGVCAICQRFEITKRVKRLVVDHCHASGKLRALLCHRCNCAIGYFQDNVKLVRRAIAYLESFNADSGEGLWSTRVRAILAVLPEEGGEEVREQVLGAANDAGALSGFRGAPATPEEMGPGGQGEAIHTGLQFVA